MSYQSTKRFFIESAPLLVLVLLPLSVHAGVFTSIAGMLEDTGGDSEESAPPSYTAQSVPLLKAALHIDPNPAKGGGDVIIDEGALVPDGDVRQKGPDVNSKTANGEISVYVVREGDTLSQIASMFDVSANTVLWANDIEDGIIHEGDTLVILPITGIRHVVKAGDTIESIAKKYDGDAEEILSYNRLSSSHSISVGDTVVVPSGVLSVPTTAKKVATPTKTSGGNAVATGNGSDGFSHPLPGSVRTQGIHGYNGVDLAASAGTAIRAAADGEVIVSKGSGWNGGYGNYVVIKHSNGTQTLYAHNSSNAVVVGESVSAGEVIGYVGNTGKSTGNHLHFEVRGARNPF